MNKSIDDLRSALETIRKEHFPEIDQSLVQDIIDIQAGTEDDSIKSKKVMELIEKFSKVMDDENA